MILHTHTHENTHKHSLAQAKWLTNKTIKAQLGTMHARIRMKAASNVISSWNSNLKPRLNNKLNSLLQMLWMNIETWDSKFNLLLSSSWINVKMSIFILQLYEANAHDICFRQVSFSYTRFICVCANVRIKVTSS